MAGVSTDSQPRAGRRPLDSEVNMIPMIDLLVCCISFLLITAVWSHMARIPMRADAPGGTEGAIDPQGPDRALHVEIQAPDTFRLVWRQGKTVISSADVPRRAVEAELNGVRQIRYPDLAIRMQAEWDANGSHRDVADPRLDRAVLHSENRQAFGELVAMLDAIHSVRRGAGTPRAEQAFAVTFSASD